MSHTLLFMGTPEFAVPTLQAIIDAFPDFKIHVITQPDTLRGRGQKEHPTPIKELAIEHQIPVHHPKSKDELSTIVDNINPTTILIIAYGMIIPKTITDRYFCLNIHGSILPKYRGPSPIHAALLNGDTETGITIMRINEKMDAGNILHIETIPIQEHDNFKSVHDNLSKLSARSFIEYMNTHVLTGNIHETIQDETQVSYCSLIKKEDSCLDLSAPANITFNMIRAFSPKPGAYVQTKTHRLKILDATIKENKLIPTTVQPEGKAPMSFHDYCLGHPEGKGLFQC